MHLRIATAVALALCGAVVGTGAAAAPSAEGFDALRAVIGNTMTVTGVPGGKRVIYLGKDGTLRGVIDGRPNSGSWTFADGKLCFAKGTGGRTECGVLKVSGTAGTFTIDGKEIAFTLEPGDTVGGGPGPAPAAAAGGGSTVSGAKGSDALVGNTIEGAIESKGLTTVFLHKDGTVRIRQGEKVIAGKWSTQGGAMCIDVERRKDCFTVEVDGTKVTLRNEDKKLPPLVFTLLTGNARNL